MSTVGLVLCLLFINPLADVLSSSRELVVIGAFGLWVSMNFDILAGIYRIEQRPTAFVVYSLVNVALTVVLSIILVIPLDLGAAGIMIGNFSGTYITYVLLLYARRETVALALDRPLLRRMLDFSLPLMPAGLALWALNLADRFQVINLASPHRARLVLGGVQDLARDHAADRGVPDGVGAVRQLVHRRGRGEAHLPGRLLVLVGADRVGGRGDEPLRAALHPPAHAARRGGARRLSSRSSPPGSALFGAYMILSIGVNRSKRTKLTPVVNATAAAINIGLNFLLIPAWGIVGAGVSTVVGYAALAGLGFANAQAGYPVSHDWRRVFRTALVAAVFLLLSAEVVPATGWVGIPARIALLALFPLALVAAGVLNPGERRRIAQLFADMRRPREGKASRGGRRARGRAGGGGAGVTTALSEEPARTAGRRVLRRNRRLCARPRGTAGAARRTAGGGRTCRRRCRPRALQSTRSCNASPRGPA